MKKSIINIVFIFIFIQQGFSQSVTVRSTTKDSLLFSFVVVGCNRVDKSDYSIANPSTANYLQLNRTFQDILALKNKPKFFFFVGDMVLGYTNDDTTLLRNELTAWVNLYKQSCLPQVGIELVPTPGNHEVLAEKKKPASSSAEQVFVDVMKPYIKNDNGPMIGGSDSLKTDQRKLTYSFDYGNTHFVMLNTDDVDKVSMIPYHWVINDINEAVKKGAEHIFTLGHKPAFPYPGEDGLNIYPEQRDSFWTALEACHSEAMFAAHNHIYYRTQPHANKTFQIISGNGGSPLSAFANTPQQKNFGFVVVEIYKSGKVLSIAYGRDEPSNGYLGDPTNYPTTIRDAVDITWGK